MRTDISKNTFRPEKNFSSVRRQQGRVDLDADWNEQIDINNNRVRILTTDSLGPVGAPENDAGFLISPTGDSSDLTVSAGRFYIDGVLVNNAKEFTVSTQPDLPGIALPAADGNYLAYLKVHERSVTALEAPEIREIALGGPDTTTRTQVVRQVHLTPVTETDIDSRTIPADWNTITSRILGRMSARTQADDAGSDPCAVGTRGGYTGLDNLLYRVEIHNTGVAGTATYKWSRDNGALVSEWLEQDGNTLTLRSTGNDNVLNFAPGQWVEISDDGLELEGKPGTLAQILRVEGRRITINPDNVQHFPGSSGTLDIGEFSRGVRKVRRWDMVGQVNPPVVPDGAGGEVWITLENGIEVKFDDAASGREYRTGDYWMFAARANINNIEWACDNEGNIEHEPHGTYFYFARLAFVNLNAGAWSVIADAREIFPGLTNEELAYVGGDGQLSVPGETLDRPLEVRVTRGATPVADAKVRFTVTSGTSNIEDAPGGTTGVTLDIKADSEGIARVFWTLADATAGQSVRAVLLDESDNETALYVVFGAGSGVASGIQYTPISADASVAGTTNVQEALDALADNKLNRSGDTMTGNLTVNADLEVTGNMTIRGDVIARDAQQQAGDVLLGDDDIDRVIIHGTLGSNHTSGALEIEAPVHVRTTDPTKSPLRVDGPTSGGSPRLYRLPLTLDHTDASAATLNDYQVLIIVDTATPVAAGRMKSDGADVIFEDIAGNTLPFWIESGINTATTRIWVRVPQITAGTTEVIHMLYGNDNAVSQSSTSATFVREVPNVQIAYDLNEGSGNTTTDLSGNSLGGNIQGSASWTAGLFGQALDFDGSSTVVSIPPGNYIGSGSTPFTASVWFRAESWNPSTNGVPVRLSQDSQFGMFFWTRTDQPQGIDAAFRGNNHHTLPVDLNALLNSWTHLVAVYNGGDKNLANSFEIYLNGVRLDPAGANLAPGPVGGTFNDNALGSDVDDAGTNYSFFNGQMADMRVYTRALSPTEVGDIYTNKGYVTPNNPGVELVRRFAPVEPVITASPEEANPLTEAPILFAQESSGNVGIGTDAPDEKLTVDGIIETKTGGIKFPDGTIQTTAGGPGGSGGEPLPLGTIMAWHRDFAGAPAVPDGWVECNGQILSDVDSPYDGLVIPNLNGEKRFLRGGDASGTMQDDEFRLHTHPRYHSPLIKSPIAEAFLPDGLAAGPNFGDGGASGIKTGEPIVASGGDETRPINMSVVWIMKVRETGEAGLWTPNSEGIHYNAGKVSVGTDVSDEQLTVTGAISLEEKILEPDTTDDFGKIYVRENDLSHLRLNGTDQYVSMPALGNTSVGDFTIALWFFRNGPNAGPNNRTYLLDMRGDGTQTNTATSALALDNGADGRTILQHFTSWPTGSTSNFHLDLGMINGEWHHTALVREGAVLRTYFDGRLLSDDPAQSTAKNDLLNWNNTWRLGTWSLSPGSAPQDYWTNGDLDDLGMWTRALSTDEIAALHNGGRGSDVVTGFASSLLAFYPMSPSLTAGQLDDTSGNDFHGTIQNGASIIPERVGSLYFKDGFGNVTSLAGGGDSYRTGGSGNQVPLGTIMAWHKSFTNTPAIPDGWVECNGQTLDDPASPYNGQVIPDLNNPKESWNSKGSFLRGDLVSGDFVDDVFQGHIHQTSGVPQSIADVAAPGGPGSNFWVSTTNKTTGDPIAGSHGTPRLDSETAPVNMSVVWIMKVRETDRDRGLWRESGEDIYFDDGKVGVGAKTANAKLHVSSNDLQEAPLRVDAKVTLQGIQGRLYRSAITVENTDTNDIADDTVTVTLDTATLVSEGKLRADGADMLFVDTDGKTILPHVIAGGINTVMTVIQVRIPFIPGGESRTIFAQYGKPDARSSESPLAIDANREIGGLALAWNFDEGSGTTIFDSSGGGKTATGTSTWTTGYRGQALNFVPPQGITTTSAHTWGFADVVTVSAWIRTTSAPAGANTIFSLQHGVLADEVLLTVLADGRVYIYNHNASSVYARRGSTSSVLTGDWVHVVGVLTGGVDPNAYRVYVNGVREDGPTLILGAPFPISDATPRTASVGGRPNTGENFTGDVDMVRVYDHALSDAEVADLFDQESLVTPAFPGREFLYTSLSVAPTINVAPEEPNPVSGSPVLFAQNLTGNVGVGTDEPEAKLHIAGEAGVDGIMFPDGTLQTTAGGGGGGDSTPLGTIIAWHKNLSGTPTIPEGWVECNGQILDDDDSPFHNQVIPNLNGDERFLRGGNVSGNLQEDAFQGHHHRFLRDGGSTNVMWWANGVAGGDGGLIQRGSVDTGQEFRVVEPEPDGTNGTPRTDDETRPVNMSVVWIMKVKQTDGQSGLWSVGGEGIRYDEGKVSVGTAVADEQLTVSGAISLEEKILEPNTTDDFGKIYVRENDLSHLRLNGNDQQVDMPSLGRPAVGDFTIAIWFKQEHVAEAASPLDRQYLMDFQTGVSTDNVCALIMDTDVNGSTTLIPWARWFGSSTVEFSINVGNIAGEWHQLVFQREDSEMRVYMDGRLLGDTPQSGIPPADPLRFDNPWIIGNYVTQLAVGPQNRFKGDLDDCGIWERALSSDEIATLYNSGRGSDVPVAFASSLIAFYSMSPSSTPSRLNDSSGNNLHGTIQNGASIIPERVGSLYFKDGFGNVTSLAGGGDSYRTGGSGNQVPLGTIMAWHKSFANTPAIPDGWVECDGQTLDDPASPYHGQTIPDLNNAKETWNSKGSFLRGDNISGDFEDDAFQGHRHELLTQSGGGADALPDVGIGSSSTGYSGAISDYQFPNGMGVGIPKTDGTNGDPRTDSETRPANMSVVWIMKVRETDRDRGLWREQGEDIYFDDGKVGMGAKTANAKVHIAVENGSETPFRIDGQTTLQGVQGRLYRTGITLENTDTEDLIDHQIAITLDTQTLVSAGKMRFDGGDILFVDTDGKTLLPHYIESGINSATTKIWVRVPEILAGETRLVFIQYGKPDATSQSSAKATFIREIDGIAAAYTFDEGTGGSVTDYSGNALTGSVSGAAWTADRNGNANRALLFDGQNDFINLSNPPELNLTSDLTLSAWFYCEGPGTGAQSSTLGMIISKHYTGGARSYDLNYNHTNGGIRLNLFDASDTGYFLDSSPINYNEWYHVAGTYDSASGIARIYINGIPDTSLNVGSFTLFQTSARAAIGAYQDSTDLSVLRGFFRGTIDEPRIHSRALSPLEISDLYSFGGDPTIAAGSDLVRRMTAIEPTATFASEEPNPVSGSPILFAQNLTGNIGIGTDDPQSRLHIAGTAGVDGIVFPDGTLQTSAGTSGDSTPVGTIIAWHKSLSGTPTIPNGWVECNGQILDDIESPYHTLQIPDLNNPKESWNLKGSFLRGDTTSGNFEDDAFQGHWHNLYYSDNSGSIAGTDMQRFNNSAQLLTNSAVNDAVPDGTNGTPRTDSETRPVNMTVVWIIKVKLTDSSAWLSVPAGLSYTGDVGIGTTEPNSKLTIQGALSLSASSPAPDETLGFGKLFARENSIRNLEFDGTGDYVDMPALGETNVGDFTYSCWFKLNAHNAATTTYILDFRHSVSPDGPWLTLHDAGADGTNFNPGVTENGSGVHHFYNVGNVLSQWHHAAFVRVGNSTRSYFDGVLVSDVANIGTSTGDTFDLNQIWRLGTASPPQQEFALNGGISQVAIWRRPLAGFEISKIFSGGREIDLMQEHAFKIMGYWPVDANDGPTLNDHSGNGAHGTLQGNVSYASESTGSLFYKDGQGVTSFLAGSRGLPLSANSSGREVPLGTIMAWHKSFTGTPAMPPGWVECNGQVLSDAQSPYDGETIPNLNGDPVGANSPDLTDKKSMFLRGGLTSGAGQDDAFQGHIFESSTTGGLAASGFGSGSQFAAISSTNPIGENRYADVVADDGVNGTPRIADETRPTNMTVVWIMKIKHTGNGAWESVSSGVSFMGERVGIGTNLPETTLHVDGYVTKQNVAFTVENTAIFINDGSEAILPYGNTLTNTGNGFQGDDQTFVAPVAGTYVFSIFFNADPGASGNDASKLMRIYKTDVDTSIESVLGTARSGASAGNQRDSVSLTVTAELKQGDTIDTRSSAVSGSALHFRWYYFSGWRL